MTALLRPRSLAVLVVVLLCLGSGVSLADGFNQPSDDQETSQGEEGSGSTDGTVVEQSGRGGFVVDPVREAACLEAAGIVIPEEGTDPVDEPALDTSTHGQDTSFQRVLNNCIRNTKAPGLLTALEHLVINQDRHETQLLANAERKAAHDAAKAERDAAHDAAKAARDAARAAKLAEHASTHGS